MNWQQFVYGIILAVIAAIPGILALVEGRRRARAEAAKVEAEKEKIEAETEETYQRIARNAAQEALGLKDEIKTLKEALVAQSRQHAAEMAALEERYRTEMAAIARQKSETEEVIRQNAVQIAALKQQYDELAATNECLVVENGELREWAEGLVHQLTEARIEPIGIKTKPRKGRLPK